MWASGKKAAAAAAGGGGFESYSKAHFWGAGDMVDDEWTKLPFQGVYYDNLGEVDFTTNERWDAAEAGIYRITCVATIKSLPTTAGVGMALRVYVNGTPSWHNYGPVYTAAGVLKSIDNHQPAMLVASLELDAGDFIEMYLWHNKGTVIGINGQNNHCTFERIA